jgi:hypothetical protein
VRTAVVSGGGLPNAYLLLHLCLYDGENWPSTMLRDGHEIRYTIARLSISGEIQIELVLEYPFGKMSETQ